MPQRRKVFVGHSWHVQRASLYPWLMDGVEYIDAAISALKRAFAASDYELRVDSDVFVPGEPLRANVEREVGEAEIIIMLLDGLRPNVVYELGMAHALQRRCMAEGRPEKRVILLAERNATVLVRNFYPNPMAVPTRDGGSATVLNPALNVTTALSDAADIIVERYDRLQLEEDMARIVGRILGREVS